MNRQTNFKKEQKYVITLVFKKIIYLFTTLNYEISI